MIAVSLFVSLVLALPVAVVAFYFGNFVVLTVLCVYVTGVSLTLFVMALRKNTAASEMDEA